MRFKLDPPFEAEKLLLGLDRSEVHGILGNPTGFGETLDGEVEWYGLDVRLAVGFNSVDQSIWIRIQPEHSLTIFGLDLLSEPFHKVAALVREYDEGVRDEDELFYSPKLNIEIFHDSDMDVPALGITIGNTGISMPQFIRQKPPDQRKRFTLLPFVGTDLVQFGMNQHRVHQVLGSPSLIKESADGIVEGYGQVGETHVYYGLQQECVALKFFFPNEAMLFGVDLIRIAFGQAGLVLRVHDLNAQYIDFGQYLLSQELGILLRGEAGLTFPEAPVESVEVCSKSYLLTEVIPWASR